MFEYNLKEGEGIRMRRKLSKKQIGAMGLAVMMGVQTPAMATETSQEAATQELQIVEPQTEVPLVEEVETTEAQQEETSTEEVETVETLTEEAQSETQTTEVQAETQAEEIQTQELENTESQQTEEQEQETSTEASTEGLIDQYALTETQEALTDGWHQDSDGNCMYVKDGAYLTNTVAEINGNYYGFDYNGIMYADTYFDLWDSESQRWVYYRAKSDGSLYVNEWYFKDEDSHMAPYYYGGDADFTNMRSYLVGQGFEDIVSDVDFPVKERMSKWGVPDDKVFARLLTDLNQGQNKKPMFRVLQTSSSHEPFDVPYHKLADESLNAFAYTDSCVGDFIKKLKASDRWENSLVIIVPDHLGCWPKNINNDHTNRYHIPLIWTGGAIAAPEKIATIGSQQDIAATLLGQLGIDHSEFIFSKDILCPTTPHFAFFTNNDLFGVVSDDNAIVHDNKLQKTVVNTGKTKNANLEKGKAYLQKLYDYISEL